MTKFAAFTSEVLTILLELVSEAFALRQHPGAVVRQPAQEEGPDNPYDGDRRLRQRGIEPGRIGSRVLNALIPLAPIVFHALALDLAEDLTPPPALTLRRSLRTVRSGLCCE